MCCTPTERLLIVLTFCHPTYCCPLNRLPAPRLLHPRSGLERSDFVLWHVRDMPTLPVKVGFLCRVSDAGQRQRRDIHQ